MAMILRSIVLAAAVFALGACNKPEGGDAEQQEAAAPAPVVAPTGKDNQEWKLYLTAVVKQNMTGIKNSPYMYYLPAIDAADFEDQYNRQLDNVASTIARTVLPGNMLAFGSPESTKMADMIVESFKEAEAGSFKGVRVLFIGRAEDAERVKAAVEPSGAEFVFVEIK